MKTISPDVELPLARFAENGMATLRRHADAGVADALRREIEAFCESEAIFAKAESREDIDAERYFLNCTTRRFQSYHQMARHSLPMVLVRNGHRSPTASDYGMIDIFNAERLFPDCRDVLRADGVCDRLQGALGGKWRLDRQHVYVNRGIQCTRPWHVDAADSPCIKMFVYLTEVIELKDGPLGYVLGTHHDKSGCVEIGEGNYSYQIEGDARTVALLAKPGDAALAFTRGIHRGMPQSPGHVRIAAVATLFPK